MDGRKPTCIISPILRIIYDIARLLKLVTSRLTDMNPSELDHIYHVLRLGIPYSPGTKSPMTSSQIDSLYECALHISTVSTDYKTSGWRYFQSICDVRTLGILLRSQRSPGWYSPHHSLTLCTLLMQTVGSRSRLATGKRWLQRGLQGQVQYRARIIAPQNAYLKPHAVQMHL